MTNLFRRASWFPKLTAGLLVVAAIATVFVLPGTEIVSDNSQRFEFVERHLLRWRLVWFIVLISMGCLGATLYHWGSRRASPVAIYASRLAIAATLLDFVAIVLMIFAYPAYFDELHRVVTWISPVIATLLFGISCSMLGYCTRQASSGLYWTTLAAAARKWLHGIGNDYRSAMAHDFGSCGFLGIDAINLCLASNHCGFIMKAYCNDLNRVSINGHCS